MPGIGIGRGLPFKKSSQNWSIYWTTRTPSNLIVTAQTDTTITFSWTAGADQPEGYRIYFSTDGTTYTEKGAVAGNVTTYQATGLTAGTLYYFKVVAYKGTNESNSTNIYDTRFKITIDTTKAGSANDTFVFGVYTHVTVSYDFYIDWGDGSAEEHISGSNVTSPSHVYSASGTYQIRVRGSNYAIARPSAGGDGAKIMYLDNWGNIKYTNLGDCFSRSINLQGRYIDVPNTASVISMGSMFYNCQNFNSPVNFTTSNVTSMTNMFRSCYKFNQSVSSFNTAKVIDMSFMFYDCKLFNQSVASFNTEKVTTMSNMFRGAFAFNQSISTFNTAMVSNMLAMFSNCFVFNQDISGLNFEAITGTGLASFLDNATSFSLANYDALLISLAAQSVHDTVTFGANNRTYTPGGAAEAARTHLTGTHSWTINDSGPSFSNGLLVINFDDGGASQYVAYQDLVTQGEKGTFYIISNIVGTGSNLTWEQLQEMYAAGMDIQCHTYTHPNLNALTQEQVVTEFTNANNAFIANDLPAPKHLAYPGGANGATVHAAMAGLRDTGRTVDPGYIIPGSSKVQLKSYYLPSSETATLKAQMLVAKQNKWAISAYGHGIDGAQVPRAMFNEIIDYAQEIGLDIVTVSELYALMT
jgi:surface protein